MSIVSNNIKYLRRLNGLTQEQFSRRIGIKRSLLGAYEEARANPNLENLKTIAQVFGTSVDSLIKTDIRKIRETPGITLGQSTTGIMEQVKIPPVSPPIKEVYPQSSAEPQPISQIVKDFFQEEPVVRTPQREIQSRIVVPEPEPTYQQYPERSNHTNNNGMKNGGEAYPKNIENKIPYVKRALTKDYLANFQKTEYIKSLSTFTLPFINSDKSRAFEMGSDFPMPNSIVVGTYVEHWANILDGKFYVLITPQQGVIYRRVYNQIKVKGTLLLSSDDPSIPSFEISLKAVAEIWEVQAFISKEMPEPRISLERAKSLIEELSLELNQLK